MHGALTECGRNIDAVGDDLNDERIIETGTLEVLCSVVYMLLEESHDVRIW